MKKKKIDSQFVELSELDFIDLLYYKSRYFDLKLRYKLLFVAYVFLLLILILPFLFWLLLTCYLFISFLIIFYETK